MPAEPTPFLTAQWRNLLMLNYEIDPELIQSRVPAGTEIDFWNGKTFVSVVGFQFLNTRVLGWHVPFHLNFEEVNLRFYVRRKLCDEWRRGVVFVKEIVPRLAIAMVARWTYNEPYISLPMKSDINLPSDANHHRGSVRYSWQADGRTWTEISANISRQPRVVVPGSEEEFITEHYWGYTAQRDGSTLEYRVEHPPWQVWSAEASCFAGDVRALYGAKFSELFANSPNSAFVADGSEIIVRRGLPACME